MFDSAIRCSAIIEELFWAIGPHPFIKQGAMSGILANIADGHLMGPPRAFDLKSVYGGRARPTLGGA
ncbi:Uncharacterised protein [Mycobacteroides abscessus subsp. abscessus]|nr:Uncharacterised protein [Mycobacteroides abscessus subsp. abscessus]SLF33330.1 Uncharacterised protein [Mycobacteroides abscessus subsp. massiliense]